MQLTRITWKTTLCSCLSKKTSSRCTPKTSTSYSFLNHNFPPHCFLLLPFLTSGVSVTLAEAKRVGRYLAKMKHGEMVRGGRARRAVVDCVECFGGAVAELNSSLGELRRLESGTFEYQMSNVETWVSAALTDQDTCLDGFGGYEGKEVGKVKAKVLNATYFISNALALVNKLASSRGL